MDTEAQTANTHSTNVHTALIPTAWPGAFGLYKHSKAVVQVNLAPYLLTVIASLFAGGVIGSIIKPQALAQTLSFLISIFITAVYTVILLKASMGEKIELGDAIKKGWEYIIPIFLSSVLVVLAVVASLLLFIIPFFFVAPRLVLVSYFVIDKDMSFTDAFKTSWERTQGHVSKVYGIVGANIAMALLFLTIIGIPFAIYFLFMYSAATVVLYKFIDQASPKTPTTQASL